LLFAIKEKLNSDLVGAINHAILPSFQHPTKLGFMLLVMEEKAEKRQCLCLERGGGKGSGVCLLTEGVSKKRGGRRPTDHQLF
jgi:hypothetical protein